MTVDLSVIIPTRDGRAALERTLAAFAQQKVGELQIELLVVDNGSADGTGEWAESRAPSFPFPLRVIDEPSPGVSAARNRAVREARGELILSVNDDTAPASAGLVAGHAAAHRASEVPIAVLGRITYPPEVLATDPFMSWLNDDAQFAYGRLERGEEPLPNHYYTAHLSFSRSVFQQLGGMDERLVFGFEDAEFGARMAAAGVGLVYRRDLVVLHDHPVTPAQWRARAERMGAAGACVNRLHSRQPPLAQPALSPYWRALAAADRMLALTRISGRSLPPRVSSSIFTVINQGSYARGYRRAWRAGSPADERAGKRLGGSAGT